MLSAISLSRVMLGKLVNPRDYSQEYYMILIVSCQYMCVNDHIFLTTDLRVLALISTDNIPLILLKSFCRKVVGLIGEAMSISAVGR